MQIINNEAGFFSDTTWKTLEEAESADSRALEEAEVILEGVEVIAPKGAEVMKSTNLNFLQTCWQKVQTCWQENRMMLLARGAIAALGLGSYVIVLLAAVPLISMPGGVVITLSVMACVLVLASVTPLDLVASKLRMLASRFFGSAFILC